MIYFFFHGHGRINYGRKLWKYNNRTNNKAATIYLWINSVLTRAASTCLWFSLKTEYCKDGEIWVHFLFFFYSFYFLGGLCLWNTRRVKYLYSSNLSKEIYSTKLLTTEQTALPKGQSKENVRTSFTLNCSIKSCKCYTTGLVRYRFNSHTLNLYFTREL